MLLTEFEAKVHVLSYSMGARVVIGALDALEEEILALDEKLKHESTHLRAKLRDKFRGVVTRCVSLCVWVFSVASFSLPDWSPRLYGSRSLTAEQHASGVPM